jgi:hypothetical protein
MAVHQLRESFLSRLVTTRRKPVEQLFVAERCDHAAAKEGPQVRVDIPRRTSAHGVISSKRVAFNAFPI